MTPAQSNAVAATKTLTLKEGEFQLRLDFNGLAEVEKATKRSFLSATAWKDLTMADVKIMVYHAIRQQHPDMTLEKVGRLLKPATMPLILEKTLECVRGNGQKPWRLEATPERLRQIKLAAA